jgi:hypothetical protein
LTVHCAPTFFAFGADPRPEIEIKSLDFESRLTRVAPFLIAVTAE